MSVTLYVIRHAEYDGNIQRIGLPGRSDERSLNPTGLVQAQNVARFFSDRSIETIISSPVRRAWQTAEIIGKPLGISPIAHEDLSEMNYGQIEGMTFAQIEQAYGHLRSQWESGDRFIMQFPEGESFADVFTRVRRFLDEVIARYAEGDVRIIVVTHLLCVHVAMMLAQRMDPRGIFDMEKKHPIPNASVTKLVWENDHWSVAYAGKNFSYPPKSVRIWLEHRYKHFSNLRLHTGFSHNYVVSFVHDGQHKNLKLYEKSEQAVAMKVVAIAKELQEHHPHIPVKKLIDHVDAPIESHPFVVETLHFPSEKLTKDEIISSDRLRDSAADILRAIHAIPVGGVCHFWQSQEYPVPVCTSADWRAFLDHVLSIRIQETRGFDDQLAHTYAQRAKEWVARHWESIKESDIAPLHGDYYPSNFCVAKDGAITAVLDFDRSMIGHTMWDLGMTRGNSETYFYPEFSDRLEVAYGVTDEERQWIVLYALLEFIGSYANNIRTSSSQADFDRMKLEEYGKRLFDK